MASTTDTGCFSHVGFTSPHKNCNTVPAPNSKTQRAKDLLYPQFIFMQVSTVSGEAQLQPELSHCGLHWCHTQS